MSNLLTAILFGAGVAAFTYSRFGRRLGYSNVQNEIILTVVVFVLTTIIFFTVLTTLLSI